MPEMCVVAFFRVFRGASCVQQYVRIDIHFIYCIVESHESVWLNSKPKQIIELWIPFVITFDVSFILYTKRQSLYNRRAPNQMAYNNNNNNNKNPISRHWFVYKRGETDGVEVMNK